MARRWAFFIAAFRETRLRQNVHLLGHYWYVEVEQVKSCTQFFFFTRNMGNNLTNYANVYLENSLNLFAQLTLHESPKAVAVPKRIVRSY